MYQCPRCSAWVQAAGPGPLRCENCGFSGPAPVAQPVHTPSPQGPIWQSPSAAQWPSQTPPNPYASPPQGAGQYPPPPHGQPAYQGYGSPPGYGYGPTQDEKTMAMLVHILGILTGLLGVLILWLIKKDESQFVDRHGRAAMNFGLSMFVYALVGIALFFTFFLIPLVIVAWIGLGILGLVCGIIGAMRANAGQEYSYPLAIPFLKAK